MSRQKRNRASKRKCDRCKGSCNVRVACPACEAGLCPTCLPLHSSTHNWKADAERVAREGGPSRA